MTSHKTGTNGPAYQYVVVNHIRDGVRRSGVRFQIRVVDVTASILICQIPSISRPLHAVSHYEIFNTIASPFFVCQELQIASQVDLGLVGIPFALYRNIHARHYLKGFLQDVRRGSRGERVQIWVVDAVEGVVSLMSAVYQATWGVDSLYRVLVVII